jgi:short subunit dehydrogenase-like uncharacterized protein
MAGRIVLFGATGYTGRLVAEALVARGAQPVLAARNAERLGEMAGELGGLETRTADVSRPDTVRALVERGDVLVSTVGPFHQWGEPAVEAAVDAGARYLDSTGEPSFIRRVFEEYGPRAERSDTGLVTAFGYDWVPGNLAGALALRDAGESAVRVAIGYFITGSTGADGMSGGTQASAAGQLFEPAYAWRDGQLVGERSAKRMARFQVDGKWKQAVSVASSEHLTLPRLYPHLREVDAYLGWFGPASRAMQASSAGIELLAKVPGATSLLAGAVGKAVKGSTGGPDAATRSKSGSHVVAIAYDAGGKPLAEARIVGDDGYSFTGAMLAWGAIHAAEHGFEGTGALGPVEAFGLDTLERGAADAGLTRVA